MDKGQEKILSKDELALVKQFVESRDNSVLVLRDFLLQFELEDGEEKFLQSINPKFLRVLKKLLVPALVRDIPLQRQSTIYTRLSILEKINPDVGAFHIKANDILGDYLIQEFENLKEGTKNREIVLADLPKKIDNDHDFKRFVNIMAYNMIVPFVEATAKDLEFLNTPPEETAEQKAKRLKQSSNK